ncbi:MAG: hypothetical protein LQ346_000009 [Caloplaca aetnensis]|nr:MAG: hypothetical protein LQ346_000009 [Caloplaca aetnensis]
MSSILAVFGATGKQGSSVIKYVLNDAELFHKYKIRAVTRDVNSGKAKTLANKVEVVHGDVTSRTSLETALTGVHTVFAMTTPSFGPGGMEIEYEGAKTIADVAVETGARYIIFSTLPSPKEISGGKYTKASHFEAKGQAERYIRGLPIKSAFYSPGFFMENFESIPFVGPQKAHDATWVLTRHTSPKAPMPLIDAVGDTGKFVGAILGEPDRFQGKTFCAATALYTLEDVAAIMSEVTGKTVIAQQIPVEDFAKSTPFEPDAFVEAFAYAEEFGYYGPDSEKLVAWAAENARGKPSTLEEFLRAHPLELV